METEFEDKEPDRDDEEDDSLPELLPELLPAATHLSPREVAPPSREEELPPEPAEEREEQEDFVPPTLSPLELKRILTWPMRGPHAIPFLLTFAAVLVLFSLFSLSSFLGGLGSFIRAALSLGVATWGLSITWRVVPDAYGGAPGPPAAPEIDAALPAMGEGLRVLGILMLYSAPAVILGTELESPILLLLLLLGGWSLSAAALLLASGTNRMWAANPVHAYRVARMGGRTYLLCITPVALLLVVRFLIGPVLGEAIVDALLWLALNYTVFTLGLLTRENEEIEDLLLQVSGMDEVLESEEKNDAEDD